MKALTVYQPWASLIACGAKRYETRSWATNYRGPIAIHAGKQYAGWYVDCSKEYLYALYDALKPVFYPDIMCNQGDLCDAAPRGAVIATAELVGCWDIGYVERLGPCLHRSGGLTGIDKSEFIFGDYTPGRYAWELANVKTLPEPIPARGYQRLWDWVGDIT